MKQWFKGRAKPAALSAALMAALCLTAPLIAEDIDIYTGVNPNGDLPNVLLVLDNSANWTTSIPAPNCYYRENGVVTTNGPRDTNPGMEQGKKIAIEKCALYNLFDALPVRTDVTNPDADALFNVGLMLLNESPNNGAYPRKAFVPLTTNNKAALKAIVAGLSINADKGSNADFSKALYEAYLYFTGGSPYQGRSGGKFDTAAFSASGRYVSPATASCGRNHIIFIANGSPEASENNDAAALLARAGGSTSLISYPTSYITKPDQANWADEFARFLRGVDASGREGTQGIVTHGVAVTGAASDGLYPNFIQAMSVPWGGTYSSASNADALLQSLLQVFNEIQAVNSVFASASLPISVNARGTYLNQVFVGMFRPDANAKPRWNGNLKQYRFGLDTLGNLSLVDVNGNPAVSTTTGFISTSAQSYWTEASTFWNFGPIGTPPSSSDAPDGEVVERGAVAQRLRTAYATGQSSRNVFTCVGCSAGTPMGNSVETRFESANTLITSTMLGVASTTRPLLIDWVRGNSNAGDEGGPTTTPATTIRPSVHGDVLHSRPAVVNYGGTTGIVVFYGANDGLLRAVNGNPSGAGAGNELWGFIPEEMFGRLNRLRANAPEVRLTNSTSATATPRDYFVDGPIGVYQKFNAAQEVERVIIYLGMRRGGRLLYAIDVTEPTVPRFLWKKSNADLPQLGQTWSEPKPARIRGHSNPVLIFGGGYDPDAEDISTPGTTTMGHRIYVLDAINGNLLKAFTTTRSVPADVSLVDADLDGYIDRAYAVDLAGKVYRVDFESANSTAVADWSIYTVADLSGGTTSGRKFFHAPDPVVTSQFTALMFGSGDREKPLISNNRDHFFQIFDRNLSKGVPAAHTPIAWTDLVPTGTTSSTTGRGCHVALDAGEKVVNAATTIGGAAHFGTNRPSTSVSNSRSCSADLGVAKSYAMPLFCVAPQSAVLVGGGLPPSPVAGIVNVSTPGGGTQRVPFCIGCINSKNSAIEGSRVNPVIRTPRTRVYWYQETRR